ncbi:MAG TPA: hypothetical protein VNS11_03575 [Sphingomicrobium sp.]|nr:hypothetical protein [Sphingomicrobium sp.]HWJ59721.1 hypothetical protein [Sphingomicrobium sp.]
MRRIICVSAALVICAGSTQVAAKAAPFQLNETSWSFVDHGKKARETIDKDGNYIENAVSGKHIDHGTAVMKDGKACFTSAMTKDGEECWTTPSNAPRIGHSFMTRNDKGRKLRVTRIAYVKLEMPK